MALPSGGFMAGSIVGKLMLDKTGWNESVAEAINKDEKQLKGMSDRTAARFTKVGTAMAIAGGIIVGAMGRIVSKASDAEETFSKFGVVFQDVAGEAEAAATDLADSYGLSEVASKRMLSATGDLLTGLGMLPGVALDLSTQAQQLAVDLASFTNYSGGAEGAADALTKAMLGEREMVKSLGIVITEEMVKEQLLAEGKHKLTGLAYKQAQAEATLTIAMNQSKNAIGDYGRTSDQFANQSRNLRANLEDITVTLGQVLLPIATQLIAKVTEVVQKVKDWMEAHPGLTDTIVKLVAALGGVMLVLGPLLIAMPKLVAIHQTLAPVLGKNVAGMLSFKAASLITAAGVGILLVALGALVVGYMKVKDAQDKAAESARTAHEQQQKLETKLWEAAESAGMTAKEFLKLRDAYKGNTAAMAMAIKRGEEGVEMQKALAEHTSEYEVQAEAAREEIEATVPSLDNLTSELNKHMNKVIDVKDETKTWIDYLKDLGIKTVEEKTERVEELEGYLDDLHQAYKDGKLTLIDYMAAVKDTEEEISSLSTAIDAEAIPAARDFGNVLAQVPEQFEDVVPDIEKEVEKLPGIFDDVSQRMKDSWTRELGEMIAGAKSFKDAAGAVWNEMKRMFADVVAKMVVNFAIDGVSDLIGGATKAASGIGEAVSSIGSATAPLAAGIGTLITTLAQAIATAAEIIAASAPAILIAAGVALAIYAGFKIISSLFKKSAKPGSMADLTRQIAENTFTIKDLLLGDYKHEIHIIQNLLRDLKPLFNKMDTVIGAIRAHKPFLKQIADNTADTVKAIKGIAGAQMGAILTEPQMVMTHGTPTNPEIVAPRESLVDLFRGAQKPAATPSVNYTPTFNVNVNGTMVTDRDYTRQRLLPEVLNALEQHEGRRRMERALGLAK